MTDCHVGCILNAICCAMYCILALASCIRLVRRRPVTFPTLLRILWRSTFFGRKRHHHHHHRNPLLSSQSSFMASGSLQFPSGTTPDGRQTTHRRHEGEEDEDETHDRASTNKQRRWPFVTSLAEWFSRNRKGDDDGATQGRRGDNSSSPCSSSATGTPSGSPNSHTTEPHRATSSSFPSGRGSSQVKSSFSRSLPFSPQALQQLKMSLMILSTLALYAAARSIEEGLLLSEHASVSSIDEYSYLVFSMFPAIGFMLLQTVLIYKWTTHTKDTLRAIRQETQGKSMMASSSSSPSKQYDTTVHTLTNVQQQPATRTGALLLGNHPTVSESSGYYPNGTGNAAAAAALSIAPSDAALWSHRSLPEGDSAFPSTAAAVVSGSVSHRPHNNSQQNAVSSIRADADWQNSTPLSPRYQKKRRSGAIEEFSGGGGGGLTSGQYSSSASAGYHVYYPPPEMTMMEPVPLPRGRAGPPGPLLPPPGTPPITQQISANAAGGGGGGGGRPYRRRRSSSLHRKQVGEMVRSVMSSERSLPESPSRHYEKRSLLSVQDPSSAVGGGGSRDIAVIVSSSLAVEEDDTRALSGRTGTSRYHPHAAAAAMPSFSPSEAFTFNFVGPFLIRSSAYFVITEAFVFLLSVLDTKTSAKFTNQPKEFWVILINLFCGLIYSYNGLALVVLGLWLNYQWNFVLRHNFSSVLLPDEEEEEEEEDDDDDGGLIRSKKAGRGKDAPRGPSRFQMMLWVFRGLPTWQDALKQRERWLQRRHDEDGENEEEEERRTVATASLTTFLRGKRSSSSSGHGGGEEDHIHGASNNNSNNHHHAGNAAAAAPLLPHRARSLSSSSAASSFASSHPTWFFLFRSDEAYAFYTHRVMLLRSLVIAAVLGTVCTLRGFILFLYFWDSFENVHEVTHGSWGAPVVLIVEWCSLTLSLWLWSVGSSASSPSSRRPSSATQEEVGAAAPSFLQSSPSQHTNRGSPNNNAKSRRDTSYSTTAAVVQPTPEVSDAEVPSSKQKREAKQQRSHNDDGDGDMEDEEEEGRANKGSFPSAFGHHNGVTGVARHASPSVGGGGNPSTDESPNYSHLTLTGDAQLSPFFGALPPSAVMLSAVDGGGGGSDAPPAPPPSQHLLHQQQHHSTDSETPTAAAAALHRQSVSFLSNRSSAVTTTTTAHQPQSQGRNHANNNNNNSSTTLYGQPVLREVPWQLVQQQQLQEQQRSAAPTAPRRNDSSDSSAPSPPPVLPYMGRSGSRRGTPQLGPTTAATSVNPTTLRSTIDSPEKMALPPSTTTAATHTTTTAAAWEHQQAALSLNSSSNSIAGGGGSMQIAPSAGAGGGVQRVSSSSNSNQTAAASSQSSNRTRQLPPASNHAPAASLLPPTAPKPPMNYYQRLAWQQQQQQQQQQQGRYP